MTAAGFYPGVTGGTVHHSFRIMALCIRLLAHPNRKLQAQVLQLTAPQFLDHRVPEAACADMAPCIAELSRLYQQALDAYPALLTEITDCLQTGKDLSDAFSPSFG